MPLFKHSLYLYLYSCELAFCSSQATVTSKYNLGLCNLASRVKQLTFTRSRNGNDIWILSGCVEFCFERRFTLVAGQRKRFIFLLVVPNLDGLYIHRPFVDFHRTKTDSPCQWQYFLPAIFVLFIMLCDFSSKLHQKFQSNC